jgi:hypothetical protein
MSGFVIRTKTPTDLTILRDKVARGERITQAEALRLCELERWLSWRIGQELGDVGLPDHQAMP